VGMRRVPKVNGKSQGEPGGHGVCISTRSAPCYQPSQAHSAGAQESSPLAPRAHQERTHITVPLDQGCQQHASTPAYAPWLHRRRLRPPPCPAKLPSQGMLGAVGSSGGVVGCGLVREGVCV
jgi:hypothetical protein